MLCSLSVSLVYIKAWSTGVSGSCDWHWTWTWTIVSINKTFSSNSIIFLMDNWGLPNHGRNWWWWICFLSTLSFNINCNKKFAQKQDLWGLFLHTSGVILPYSMKSEKSPIWRNSWKIINLWSTIADFWQSWPQRSDDHSVKMISDQFQGPSPVPWPLVFFGWSEWISFK